MLRGRGEASGAGVGMLGRTAGEVIRGGGEGCGGVVCVAERVHVGVVSGAMGVIGAREHAENPKKELCQVSVSNDLK